MEASVATFRWIAVLPNLLSAVRLGVAVAFPLLPPAWRPTAVVVAAASDALDGYLARKLRATSWQGGLLDAAADKFFVLSVLWALTREEALGPWMVLALLGRDLTVALIAAYAALRRWWWSFRLMRPRLLGKVTTAALFGLFLVKTAWPDAPAANQAALALTAGLSLLAGADYFLAFLKGLMRVVELRRRA